MKGWRLDGRRPRYRSGSIMTAGKEASEKDSAVPVRPCSFAKWFCLRVGAAPAIYSFRSLQDSHDGWLPVNRRPGWTGSCGCLGGSGWRAGLWRDR